MGGETRLETLLGSMQPELRPGTYVFASVPSGDPRRKGIMPMMSFREEEGETLILSMAEAEAAGLSHAFPCRMITLTIHSALDAVGFLAAITARLAAAGIPVNPVSAFHHDHLFVPEERAADVMEVLKAIARECAFASPLAG